MSQSRAILVEIFKNYPALALPGLLIPILMSAGIAEWTIGHWWWTLCDFILGIANLLVVAKCVSLILKMNKLKRQREELL